MSRLPRYGLTETTPLTLRLNSTSGVDRVLKLGEKPVSKVGFFLAPMPMLTT